MSGEWWMPEETPDWLSNVIEQQCCDVFRPIADRLSKLRNGQLRSEWNGIIETITDFVYAPSSDFMVGQRLARCGLARFQDLLAVRTCVLAARLGINPGKFSYSLDAAGWKMVEPGFPMTDFPGMCEAWQLSPGATSRAFHLRACVPVPHEPIELLATDPIKDATIPEEYGYEDQTVVVGQLPDGGPLFLEPDTDSHQTEPPVRCVGRASRGMDFRTAYMRSVKERIALIKEIHGLEAQFALAKEAWPPDDEQMDAWGLGELPLPLTQALLRNMLLNARKHNKTYEDFELEIAFVLHAMNSAAYRLFRFVFYGTLPCESKINDFIRSEREEILKCVTSASRSRPGVMGYRDESMVKLLDRELLKKFLLEYRDMMGIREGVVVRCTLAFDATAATQTGLPKKGEASPSCFAFLLLPLDHSLPDLLLQSVAHNTGRIDETIVDLQEAIVDVMASANFECNIVATDGDKYMDRRHTEFFNIYQFCGGNLAYAVEKVTDYKPLNSCPVSDFLHLLKNARARALCHQLAVNRLSGSFSAEDLTVWLGKEKIFQKLGSRDLLKDGWALLAFSLDNLILLADGGHYVAAYYFLPFVALNLAIRNPELSKSLRLDLIKVAFNVFYGMRADYPRTGGKTGVVQNKTKKCGLLTLWTRQVCERGCNLCIALYWAIDTCTTVGIPLGMNRIGTHPVECHFGTTRSALCGEGKIQRFWQAETDACIVQRIMKKYSLKHYIRGFMNEAGCTVTDSGCESVNARLPDGTMLETLLICSRKESLIELKV
jgi:hypothetical protein